MADQTPNSLIKVDAPITSRFGLAQILCFTAAGFTIIYILQFMFIHRANMDVINYGSSAILAILVLTYVCARSDYSLFKTERFLVFNTKKLLKSSEIHKYSKKTNFKKAKKFTLLESADQEGRFKFKTCSTYGTNKCNYGFCWCATPSNPKNLEAFFRGMEKVYNSIPQECIQKQIIAQSKDLTNIAEAYAKKLEIKGLPLMVRNGIEAQRQFFEVAKDRVGWMYVIFMGVGYFVDEGEACEKIDEIRDSYGGALDIAGVNIKPVMDAEDYAIVYSQMFHMKRVRGVL